MARITIAAPSQKVHRFLLPPDARHVMHYSFLAGSVVLAKVLTQLLLTKKERSKFTHEIGKLQAVEHCLPNRYIKLHAYDAAPALEKHLKPETQFLRVHEYEDSDGYHDSAQMRFVLESSRMKTSIVVVGGMKSETAWNKIEGKDLNEGCVVYVVAKSAKAMKEHCVHARTVGEDGNKRLIVGQIDLADLAKDYPLQKDTSYERTIGSICGANANEGQDCLTHLLDESALNHLIIRIGNAACLVASRGQGHPDLRLCYHPERCAPTNSPGLGSMLAYDIVLACAMVRQLCLADDLSQVAATLHAGALVAVQATYRCFCEGFGPFHKKTHSTAEAEMGDDHPAKVPADDLFVRFVKHGLAAQGYDDGKLSEIPDHAAQSEKRDKAGSLVMNEPKPKGTVDCEVDYTAARSPSKFWRMVVPESKGATQGRCRERALAYLGVSGYNEDKPLPIVRIGKLQLVDRHEVEDYLFLQHLLRGYQADENRKKPLSIGVFGQPGGGKSFGVKQLVQEMSGGNENFAKDEITINMTQLRSLDELADNFHKVRNTCLKGVMPLVFFDEFDAGFEGQSFGWLKYFLAPMQDGEFLHKGSTYHFGKAIFVFAGGVSHAFSEFNERSRNPNFCEAKGPDFISRLRGVLNIKGMNRPNGDEEEIEHIYMIRRAVFLLEELKRRLGNPKEGLMEERVANAFLKTLRFKHGVRSMEAILDMSSCEYGEMYRPCHLPPRSQLDMHVDAREFLRHADMLVSMDNC